tara:strand:+ start:2665 stop:3108 length:444 start_codon:yes stop_codon:yes gene_type:complete
MSKMNINKSMMLTTSNWGPNKTFKMIPINKECPYVEAIFDPSSKILAIISKTSKNSYHMVPKLDDNGDEVTLKIAKRKNGKDIKEQRVMMDTHAEYYISEKEEIVNIVNGFAINADSFKIEDYFGEEAVKASKPLTAEKATNLNLVG